MQQGVETKKPNRPNVKIKTLNPDASLHTH